MPWDLSEVDAEGRPLPAGDDDQLVAIGLVLVLIAGIGAMLAAFARQRFFAIFFTAGATLTWAALFAWRAGTARTSGANLFLVPLVLFVIPAASITPMIVGAIAR